MSITIKATDTVTLGEKSFAVTELPENIQELLAIMDVWREKEADFSHSLSMARTAISTLQQQIGGLVAQWDSPPVEDAPTVKVESVDAEAGNPVQVAQEPSSVTL